jgi:hypothetical protein
MAKDMLSEEYHGKRESVSNEWHSQVEVAKLNGGIVPNHPGFPPYPTEQDVVKKAQELNGFVSNIDTKVSKKS